MLRYLLMLESLVRFFCLNVEILYEAKWKVNKKPHNYKGRILTNDCIVDFTNLSLNDAHKKFVFEL